MFILDEEASFIHWYLNFYLYDLLIVRGRPLFSHYLPLPQVTVLFIFVLFPQPSMLSNESQIASLPPEI